ncbi:hypothetical protein ACWGPQ_21920 [Saccharomonospora azurea]
MTTTLDPKEMPTQRLLSGLHVPADLGETTAPLDVVDRPKPAPAPTQEPAPIERSRPEPPTPSPAPVEAFRPEKPTPTPVPVATSTTTPPPAPPQPPVMRPEPPKPPTKPGSEHFKMERALNVGYWMSVAVGAIGQIVSFGGMIAPNMPADMAWTAYLAAAMLAAFAEITMVGCGTAALKRRFDEGAWKALASIACLVCLYATALNAIHWYPVDPGMAVMFAGGSFLGFTAHFIAEHTAASDYEKALARYRRAAGIPAPDDDVKPSKTTTKRGAKPADKPAVKAQTPRTASKPKSASKRKTSRKPELTRDEAVRWSEENGKPGPSTVIRHFAEQGYATPSVATMRRWLNS